MHLSRHCSWMETGVCVWLCGGSWGFGTMWHVYCLGDLGQWSTSGTSHNRVNTSMAIRHPTRQVGREREARAKKHLGSFSFSHTYTNTHTHTQTYMHWGLCAFWELPWVLQVHLDSDGEEQEWRHMCVCGWWWGACLTDSIEAERSPSWVSNSPVMPTVFFLYFFWGFILCFYLFYNLSFLPVIQCCVMKGKKYFKGALNKCNYLWKLNLFQ